METYRVEMDDERRGRQGGSAVSTVSLWERLYREACTALRNTALELERERRFLAEARARHDELQRRIDDSEEMLQAERERLASELALAKQQVAELSEQLELASGQGMACA